MSPFLWNIQATEPSFAEVAAVLAEGMADLADGAIAIVGGEVEQHGDAAGTVAFEIEFLVGRARQFAGAALDGALDVVGRHVLGLGVEDGLAQARVLVGIAAATWRPWKFRESGA